MTGFWFADEPFDEDWYDEAAGPLVRPYAMTGGRTAGAGHDLDMLTAIVTARAGPTLRRTEPEYRQIRDLCRTPVSIAEVSASLGFPLAVTKILVGDLIDDRILIFRPPVHHQASGPDVNLLRAVLDGIRSA
ncbi:MAG: hypothetical protein JWN03_6395 [Nocardia sp.]|uniref:DUF742 domain-containing protein n=1 Tax=Nocardia sp. TaxID=1821 RepID=UPI0026166EFB|nr:DUF742 domain-containing protein [Nocardia sp.]MCU1646120.1 hypothetical protein [Nocardia sp.]